MEPAFVTECSGVVRARSPYFRAVLAIVRPYGKTDVTTVPTKIPLCSTGSAAPILPKGAE